MSSSTTLQCIESSGGDNTLAIQCLASAMEAAAGLDSTVDEVVFDINDLKGKSTTSCAFVSLNSATCTNRS